MARRATDGLEGGLLLSLSQSVLLGVSSSLVLGLLCLRFSFCFVIVLPGKVLC